MGRIGKNGFISGSVSNLVFVNRDGVNIVRSKPGVVKQSENTKRAAGVFGYVSQRDASYRRALMYSCKLTADKGYAYRHRAAFHRMAVHERTKSEDTVSLLRGNPKLMETFNFNRHLEWQKCCRFFPEVLLDQETATLTVELPELRWKKEVMPPAGTGTAEIRLMLVAVQPDVINSTVKLLGEWRVQVSVSSPSPADVVEVKEVPGDHLLFLIGEIRFTPFGSPGVSPLSMISSAYLWGGKITV